MDPIILLKKYCKIYKKKDADILIEHCKLVAKKALEVAKKFPKADKYFIYEAAILHDIGVAKFDREKNSRADYIYHGIDGKEILEKEGYPKHALVCDRHIGVGLSKLEAKERGLPERDMNPVSLEEEIVSYADKFFSKHRHPRENTIEEIHASLAKFGKDKIAKFDSWHKKFG